ncbi:MAG TPA: hypothetical protein EYM84_04620 [Flavobacteriales bacterium]|nr:hypothetical protein [Flavobacteriales bacterium]HIN39537.1 hypothetical protein [Flavobacteriales bacterium]
MRTLKTHVALLVISSCLLSCAPKIPFTQSIRDEHNLKDADLKALQFYNSHDIVLNRAEKSDAEQETVEGTLTIKTGQSVEQIIIKEGTPGLVQSVPGENKLRVSFEVGDNAGLMFGAANSKVNERYSLMAPSWNGNRGKIQYNGQTYYTSRNSGDTYLRFKMRRLNKYIKKQRVVKGRKI